MSAERRRRGPGEHIKKCVWGGGGGGAGGGDVKQNVGLGTREES